jgi:hypothetical protein
VNIMGSWDVTINTPFGAQVLTLKFADEHTGVARYRSGSVPLQNVAVSGNTATCSVRITEPMSVTLKCSVEVDGDFLSGTASAGFFGRFALTGRRTSA